MATEATTNTDALSIDLQDLTLDEIDLVEEVLDAPFDSISKPGARKGPFLRAIALVVKHRESPEEFPVAPADALKESLAKVGRLKVVLTEDAPNPPAPSEQ